MNKDDIDTLMYLNRHYERKEKLPLNSSILHLQEQGLIISLWYKDSGFCIIRLSRKGKSLVSLLKKIQGLF